MKTYKFTLSLVMSVFCFANEPNIDRLENDLMFDKISKERMGLKTEQIDALEDPFVSSKDENKIIIQDINGGVNNIFVLRGIMGNRAKINDAWYKIGDNLESVTITAISNDSVTISNDEEEKILKIVRENENVKFSK